jgi:two-component system, response regulator PdtaR
MRSYLIVDDNRALADNLAEIVREQGDAAAVAASGPEALDLVARERFDAILTDMRMPAMDGAVLIREVRRADPGLPAVVVTAYFKDGGLRAAQREGLLAVLPKPVPVAQLLHLLGVAKRNGRVVLVEDDIGLRENLAEVLQGHGFSVLGIQSVAEIEDLPKDAPLLAVADLRVPGAPDGAAAERLAARYPGLPLLTVTGFRDIPRPARTLGCFVKPFDTAALLAAVERLHHVATPSETP